MISPSHLWGIHSACWVWGGRGSQIAFQRKEQQILHVRTMCWAQNTTASPRIQGMSLLQTTSAQKIYRILQDILLYFFFLFFGKHNLLKISVFFGRCADSWTTQKKKKKLEYTKSKCAISLHYRLFFECQIESCAENLRKSGNHIIYISSISELES